MTKQKYNEVPVKDNMKVEVEVDVNVNEEVKEKKNLKKLVDVQPKKVKHGLLGRLIHGVMGPEGLPSIGAYVNDEIVKPAIKNIIVDAVTSGINMVMYGEKSPSKGGTRPGYGGHRSTSYRPSTNYSNRYSNSRPETEERRPARPLRYGVEEYIIEERFDAAHVLTTLTENADAYDSVSVADYYDLIGVPSQYTDNTYGWTIDSITQASIVPVRGGYIIKFPAVEVI